MEYHIATTSVNKERGLRLKDLSLIASIAQRYQHDIQITIGGTVANAKDIFSVARLMTEDPAQHRGRHVTIQVSTGEAGYEKAAAELKEYFENGWKSA